MDGESVKEIWKRAHRLIKEECGDDKSKLMLAELVGLRQIAMQIAAASVTPGKASVKRTKSFVRK
jgi:uncharacterized cupin superfamily protein